MKFPQIYQIWRNRSVLGLNIHSLYFECAENLPFVVYNLVQVLGRVRLCNLQGYPFSTFGESVMILIQAIIQVLLFHQQCWCKGAMYSFTTDVNVNGKLLFRNFSLLFLSALLIMFIPPKVRLFSLPSPLVSNSCPHHQHSLRSLCSHSPNHHQLQAGTHRPIIAYFVVVFACWIGCADLYDADGGARQVDFVYVHLWICVQFDFSPSDFIVGMGECV